MSEVERLNALAAQLARLARGTIGARMREQARIVGELRELGAESVAAEVSAALGSEIWTEAARACTRAAHGLEGVS